jgi:ribonuclease BN (tRNA processing enzyme)
MTVTILGSGTGLPSLERSSPAYLLAWPGGRALIDCGAGTLRRLLRAGQSPSELAAVFITHCHADHISDLVPLVHALAIEDSRREPLELIGPAGFPDLVEQHILALATRPSSFPIGARVAAPSVLWRGLEITTTATAHSARLPSLAYRFGAAGRSVVFSGDTDHSPELARFATAADLLVLDCSFSDAHKVAGHLAAGECGLIAAEAGVTTVVLSHLYPEDEPMQLRLEQCRANFAGTIVLAEDLLRLTL